ncbi:MAG: prepilin-type N-terminal cleavage/methylation domain-containing protein [Epsilonproteobacteria bacterium]|nr:prepilin-type N-terminal cleavage/methylation domain-containing protein [Campylobacterota bacterium]
MIRRYAFTMIELIFVIVVMGILAKFGTEFLVQAYNGFIASKINNELQSKSEAAVEQIAARLQYRIKASVIGRDPSNSNFHTNFKALTDTTDQKYSILEWISVAHDSFRGTTKPLWSGIIDIDPSIALGTKILVSPETNTTVINNIIKDLRPSGSTTTFNNAAIYFIGSNSNVYTGFGWDTNNNDALYPIDANNTNTSWLVADNNFSGVDVYEYYQLTWTAYAVGIDNNDPTTLKLWYDYQPWEGEKYTDGTSVTLMENVSTFQYNTVGSILKIQVCAASTIGAYSLCKEKTVY